MRTVHYSEVLNGSAALAGVGSGDVGEAEFALFRSFHDLRLQQAWEIHRWPELCRCEQRLFRPKWLAGHAYAAGDERFDVASGQYYQSLVDNNEDVPSIDGAENSAVWAVCASSYGGLEWVTGAVYAVGDKVLRLEDGERYQCIAGHTAGGSWDGSKWGKLKAFDRYVGLDQVEDDGTVLTPVGEIFRAVDANPRVTTKLVEYPFELSENGAQFATLRHAIMWAWLEFRVRRPELTGEAWDAGRAYGAGEQVYYVTGTGAGDFYTATAVTVAGESPETAGGKWAVVELPYVFRGYLIQGGYADWLTSDGQGSKATAAEGRAWGYLELEADKLQRQQGQVRRVRWAV